MGKKRGRAVEDGDVVAVAAPDAGEGALIGQEGMTEYELERQRM
jgi:hypothetical protein